MFCLTGPHCLPLVVPTPKSRGAEGELRPRELDPGAARSEVQETAGIIHHDRAVGWGGREGRIGRRARDRLRGQSVGRREPADCRGTEAPLLPPGNVVELAVIGVRRRREGDLGCRSPDDQPVVEGIPEGIRIYYEDLDPVRAEAGLALLSV